MNKLSNPKKPRSAPPTQKTSPVKKLDTIAPIAELSASPLKSPAISVANNEYPSDWSQNDSPIPNKDIPSPPPPKQSTFATFDDNVWK